MRKPLVKKIWLFAFLTSLLFVFFSCIDTARLGLYHYVRDPSVSNQAARLYPVYVDKDFGEADRISIQDALDQWNIALHGQARFIINNHLDVNINNGFLLFKITSHNPLVKPIDKIVDVDKKGIFWTLGFTSQIGDHHVYLVRDRLQNEDVKYIVMHELGHALGAAHGGSGLMSVPYNKEKWQCVDQYTVQQIAAHEHLVAEDLNYCVVP